MTKNRTRREFLRNTAAVASAAMLPMPAIAQGAAARVVVIGGGFAGASAARAVKPLNPNIGVTLVESNATFTACPFSNAVIAGMREISAQQFGYDKVRASGVNVVMGTATGVNAQGQSVTLADGASLPYDRLIVAPGIDF